jgi:hypothetical protein
MKNSNSLLEAFLRRRLAIHFSPWKGTLTSHSWFVKLNQGERRVSKKGLSIHAKRSAKQGEAKLTGR